MQPIFKKCLLGITHINEQSLPAMGQAYNQFTKKAESEIINNECLNRARMYTKSAIEALNSAQIDNSNIKNQLYILQRTDEKLNSKSRHLSDKLNEIKYKFTRRSEKIGQLNNIYLNEMKNGNTPAQELLVQIAKLGKDVQKVVNEEIPMYEKEVNLFMKQAVSTICDEADSAYKKILKLDSGTLPHKNTREWTHLPDSFLRTSGAFVNASYDIG